MSNRPKRQKNVKEKRKKKWGSKERRNKDHIKSAQSLIVGTVRRHFCWYGHYNIFTLSLERLRLEYKPTYLCVRAIYNNYIIREPLKSMKTITSGCDSDDWTDQTGAKKLPNDRIEAVHINKPHAGLRCIYFVETRKTLNYLPRP